MIHINGESWPDKSQFNVAALTAGIKNACSGGFQTSPSRRNVGWPIIFEAGIVLVN